MELLCPVNQVALDITDVYVREYSTIISTVFPVFVLRVRRQRLRSPVQQFQVNSNFELFNIQGLFFQVYSLSGFVKLVLTEGRTYRKLISLYYL